MIAQTSSSDPTGTGWTLAAMVAVAVLTQVGAYAVKRARSGDAPPPKSVELELIEEWQDIARESRLELGECRRERERQDSVIAGQGKIIDQLGEKVRQLEAEFRELATEVHQWRNGQRVPEGFTLARVPLPPAPPVGGT